MGLIPYEYEIKCSKDCEDFRCSLKTYFYGFKNTVCGNIILVNIKLVKRECKAVK